jgi:hypothetical protein
MLLGCHVGSNSARRQDTGREPQFEASLDAAQAVALGPLMRWPRYVIICPGA